MSFNVSEGEVFGFLGPNGAGKTTTVRMLCCLISKTSGEARKNCLIRTAGGLLWLGADLVLFCSCCDVVQMLDGVGLSRLAALREFLSASTRTCSTACHATSTATTPMVKTTPSKTTIPIELAKGTRKSTNPIGEQ